MVRLLPFSIATVLFVAAFSVAIGSRWFSGAEAAPQRDVAVSAERIGEADNPGLAIPALALVDGLLLVSLALMALGEAHPATVARVGGPTVLVAGVVVIVLGIVMATAALVQLTFMLGLLATPLFGQAMYMALFGDFPRGTANATLALLMALRIGGGVALVLWSRSVLQAKGMLLLLLSALLAGVVVSFLLGMVPRVLASVTDAIAAIVVCVIAIVWGVVEVLSGAGSMLKVVGGAHRSAP
jgi:hypothetical protein